MRSLIGRTLVINQGRWGWSSRSTEGGRQWAEFARRVLAHLFTLPLEIGGIRDTLGALAPGSAGGIHERRRRDTPRP